MTYAAPLDDMRFVLNRLAGLPEIATLPGFEDADPEVVEAILIEAGRFAGEVLAPLNSTGDRQGCRWFDGKVATPDGFPAAYRQFIEGGWHSMPASTDIGGQGMPALVSSAVAEMWKSANLAFSLCQMLTMGAVEALVNHASATLKQRFLPKMVAGESTGTMNLTEPQAGSDLSAVRTRAEPDGDNYRLFGSKIFITWGEHDVAENVIHLVLARIAGRAGGHTRDIAIRRTEIPGQPGWQPRRAQRPCLRLHRTQARHTWLSPTGRDVIRRQGRGGRPTWWASRTAASNTCSR